MVELLHHAVPAVPCKFGCGRETLFIEWIGLKTLAVRRNVLVMPLHSMFAFIVN